jgi:hypothetical protein
MVLVAEVITRAEGMEIIKAVAVDTVTGYYTDEEWACLTREQRDSILEARGTKQNIGAIETDDTQQITQGNNCHVISYTDKTCQVAPYHPSYDSIQDIPIVQAGTAYNDPNTGEKIILSINQGLYFGDSLPVTLLNPNQM